MTDLRHGRDVDRMVQLAVPTQRQPADRTATGLELDRRGRRVRGEVIAVGEPVDVAGMADHHRGDDGPDTEDVGHGRARRAHRGFEPPFRCPHLDVEVTEVIEMLGREVMADLRDRVGRFDPVEELLGCVHRDFLGNTARNELEQQRMQPTHAPVPGPTQIPMPFREQPEHDRSDPPAPPAARSRARNAAIAIDNASLPSVFCDFDVDNARTRDANVAGTSNTRSPAPTSCCASR